ncbi:ABC transporter substrate-binding protein [Haladaptatus salinisoli]|uniref:ABC transporter substrate-binding protein n=1 Tax=Haladaptatus salinisoli TaxID=2884876 RepID=UPI001D09C8C8|nr:ABC transporter substrate-binding protein [Haladaptatus salinisoli]
MSMEEHGRSNEANGLARRTALSRRKYLTTTLATTAAVGSLAGCNSKAGESIVAKVPAGVPKSVETQYWHDWQTIDVESPGMEYTASAGAQLDPITVEYSSEDDPWMREHALMFRRSLGDLGAPMKLIDRPLNQLYAQSWETSGLENMISMSSQGPDPQRGLDPNPFLMRLHKENSSNYTNYWNDQINRLLEKQRQMTGAERKRKNLVSKVQRLFGEDVGDIITLFPNVITAVNAEKWEGYVPTPGNGPTGDSFQWTEVNLQPKTDERTYVKGVSTSMNSLNLPWSAGGAEEARLKFIYDGLFDASPSLEVIPGLATSAEFIDKTTVEVSLRDNVTWHDGKPFSADDVVFSTNLYIKKTSTSQGTFYEPIESVEKRSNLRVQFNLKRPDASFTTQRMVRSIIVPKHRWKEIDTPSQHNPGSPIGTGPFKFEDWDQGTRFAVSRNEGHWMFDDEWRQQHLGDAAARGPGIERVVWINVGNIDAMIGALQNGELDAIGTTLSNAQADRATNSARIERLSAKSFAPVAVKLVHSNPLIRDKEFRVALAKSLPKQQFVDDVLLGEATVPNGENYISELTKWHANSVKHYEYEPEGAREILERAGYIWDEDGILHFPNGRAWKAFVERIQPGKTHKRRAELGQADFSNEKNTTTV